MKSELDHLETKLEEATGERERLAAMLDLLEVYQDVEYVDGWKLGTEALSLATLLNDRESIARAHSGLANCLWKLAEHTQGLEHFERALDNYLGLGDLKSVALCYCGMGIIYGSLEEYRTALEYFEEGLSAARRSNAVKLAVTLTVNIGHVYFKIGRYDDGMQCFQNSLDYYKHIKDDHGAANVLGGMAGIHVYKGEYSKGLELARRALLLQKQAKRTRGIAVSMMNVGIALQKMGKLESAKKELKSALNYARSIDFKISEQDTLKNLSQVCTELEQHEEASKYLRLYLAAEKEEKKVSAKRKNEQFKQRQQLHAFRRNS